MTDLQQLEVWFITGSQHLYGNEALKQVEAHSKEITSALQAAKSIPVKLVFKAVVKSGDEAYQICMEANGAPSCIGLITWCHTFSPSKMWINGLKILQKPILHLHTQYNRDIPWSSIDMDFMNLNQAAHGDREHGFIMSRMRLNRKVVAGFWREEAVQNQIGAWSRAAAAWSDWQGARFCRFGDNMREVAVTDGNKVAAQMRFGFSVNGFGIGDLVQVIDQVEESQIERLIKSYKSSYSLGTPEKSSFTKSVRDAARIELGLRSFLARGGFKGFTTTFEDLHGLAQLPGLPAQRLMSEGYGFGAEGDWKTCALLRAFKVMAKGLKGGTSFMEDYTYHLDPKDPKVLGAHMLEICPSIARNKPSLEVHPLGIGGKEDPARLVFDTAPGEAVNVSLVDMGNRFRMILNEVSVVAPDKPLKKLPVARAIWKCKPDFKTAVSAWIYGGGAHHTVFSQAVSTEMVEDFARMADVELLIIDEGTTLRKFQSELRNNEVYYGLKNWPSG
ncbi:MAG TPA: L-arabinose isomerase [Candidatus Acidoferrales bacterium]|nr:L-arabinose isomerase [Candidatus Acidoferrales bacterium]